MKEEYLHSAANHARHLYVYHPRPPCYLEIKAFRGQSIALMEDCGSREAALAYAHLFARAPELQDAYNKACELADAISAFHAVDIKKRTWSDIMNALEAFKWARASVEESLKWVDK